MSSISLVLRSPRSGRLEGRPHPRPCPWPSFETAARRARPPQDEVLGFDFDRAMRLISLNRSTSPLRRPRRYMIRFREIGEPRHVGLELHLHCAGRAVALLTDDDLGAAVHGFHFGLPLEVLFRSGPRLAVLVVVFLAKHEQ